MVRHTNDFEGGTDAVASMTNSGRTTGRAFSAWPSEPEDTSKWAWRAVHTACGFDGIVALNPELGYPSTCTCGKVGVWLNDDNVSIYIGLKKENRG